MSRTETTNKGTTKVFRLELIYMSFIQLNCAFRHVGSRASNRFHENVDHVMMHHDGT